MVGNVSRFQLALLPLIAAITGPIAVADVDGAVANIALAVAMIGLWLAYATWLLRASRVDGN